jgi:hypothetical protein
MADSKAKLENNGDKASLLDHSEHILVRMISFNENIIPFFFITES